MPNVKAVLWDFGGVVTSSPFEAFATYERNNGLPEGFIRRVNSLNPNANAWARFERSDIDRVEFCKLFEAEARSLGHDVSGEATLACLLGAPRAIMVRALERVAARYPMACLTNNVRRLPRPPESQREIDRIMGLFDHVIESSRIGARKPEERFYQIALRTVGVAADEAVFLDDLGVNLKTARAMGMTTIKVVEPEAALRELGGLLDMNLLAPG